MSFADVRRPYLDATALDQDFLDLCAANLSNQLELAVDIETPDGSFIRASDRNKYIGSTFYEALLNFPVIGRTVGEWLSRTTEFDTLELELNNSNGRFNNYLPGGDDFSASWVGKSVRVRLGLRDVESTYFTIFRGSITDIAGVSRQTFSINFKARDKFDALSVEFPNEVFSTTAFPDLEEDRENFAVPVVLGDWTTEIHNGAAIVPSFVVNGKAVPATTTVLQCVHATNSGTIDTSHVYLRRGDTLYPIDSSNVTDNADGSMLIETTGLVVDGAAYEYQNGDVFYVRFLSSAVEGTTQNAVLFAKHLLKTYAGVTDSDFTAQWAYFAAKTTPTESAIASIKTRIWLQDPQNLLEYVRSLLQQVRLELFVDRDLKLDLVSTHFDEWPSNPSYLVRNWDIELDSASMSLPEINQFNRARGAYGFSPLLGEESAFTPYFKNQAAITAQGKQTTQRVILPNLYVASDAQNFVRETLKLSSAGSELVTMNLTWRSLLLDIGQFVKLNINIDGLLLENVPCMVRSIGYDPDGVKIPVTLWSFQMVPYPGYVPGYAGTVGGSTATITQE